MKHLNLYVHHISLIRETIESLFNNYNIKVSPVADFPSFFCTLYIKTRFFQTFSGQQLEQGVCVIQEYALCMEDYGTFFSKVHSFFPQICIVHSLVFQLYFSYIKVIIRGS